jgi:hypothetical protein
MTSVRFTMRIVEGEAAFHIVRNVYKETHQPKSAISPFL